jgi:aspartate/methionine/tyrosine aminotransferase
MISKRAKMIDSSGIRKVFDLAASLENPVDLSIGQPDFDVPDEIKEEAIEWIRRGFNKYTVTQGIPELIDEVSRYYQRRFDVQLEKVLITSGVSGGLTLAFLSLLDPGDEVLVLDPYFVMYKHLVTLFGAVPRYVDTYPDFRLRSEALGKALSKRAKAIVINSPANPTGAVLTKDELKLVAEFAEAHNLLIISDEIYEQLTYDSAPDTVARYSSNVLVLNGLSKMGGMTGWRVGYAAGPAELIERMTMIQQYTFVCAPAFAQKAAIVALQRDTSDIVTSYRRKRDIIYDGLRERFRVIEPAGAFYIFPQAPGGDADGFVRRAIENNVLIIPGNVFSERNSHFRISFAAPDETLHEGVRILNELC